MEQDVFGQREASGQWGCFVLSLNGASALLAAAFAFAPAWPPTETRMGGEGGIRAQQQPRLDIRGVGCFANICGCLFYFYVPALALALAAFAKQQSARTETPPHHLVGTVLRNLGRW
jgi:hypothetical protein